MALAAAEGGETPSVAAGAVTIAAVAATFVSIAEGSSPDEGVFAVDDIMRW